MTVALVDFVQEAWNSSGQATLTLGGLSAGQLAIVEASHSDSSSQLPSGWTYAGDETWWRVLRSSDLSGGTLTVTVRAWLTALTVVSGGAGLGRRTQQAQVRLTAATAAYFRGWTQPYRTDLAPGTYRLGAESVSPEDGHLHAVYLRVGGPGYVALDDTSDAAGFRAFEILAPAAPLAPLSLLPTSGSAVDRALPVLLSFAHQSATGQTQTACKVWIRASGGSWGSLKADGTIAAGDTSQVLTQSSGTVTIAAGVLTTGTQYEWIPYTSDASGWSPAGTTSTLVGRTAPTAVVTMSTTAGDRSPLVTATVTPGTGTLQAWRVRICAAADAAPDAPLWDSGQVTGGGPISLEVPAATSWVNGSAYRAWLLVTDSALTGAWASSASVVVSWTPPAAPGSIMAVDGEPPTVTVAGIPVGSAMVEVQSAPVGVEAWDAVASLQAPAASVVVGVPLAPYGVARRYRARSWAAVDGVLLPSAWITSAAVTSTDLGAYIVAEDLSAYVAVDIVEAGALVPIQAVARSSGMGDTVQRVDRGPVVGWVSWWLVETDTATDEATVMSWLTDPDRPKLWLRATPERPFVGGPVDVPALLTAVESPPVPERWVQAALSPRRIRWGWTTQ